MRLKGQRAIVTGGGSGIGAAIVEAFTTDGARVVSVDRDAASGRKVVEAVRGKGGDAHFVKADVSDVASVEAMVQEAVEWLGGLDILVNNAGIGLSGTLLDTKEEDWARLIAVNLTGPFLVSKYAMPHLLKNGAGCIINMASVAGLVGTRSRAAYCSTKGGLISLTRSIAVDYVGEGIRCNAICPGPVETPWTDRIRATSPDPAAARAAMIARQPMKRLGRPEEIAQAAVYLASPAAAFITGSCLAIDGGVTMQ